MPDPVPTSPRGELPVRHVSTPRELEAVADDLASADRIPLDTESNSLHAYREMVCYVQIAGPRAIYLIDTVAMRDLEPLEEAIASGPALKLLHGADYDVVCMKRDFEFGPRPIFDTMLAAQLLGAEQLGYGALVERYCDVSLDKGFQKHDWGARPLDPAAEPYLVADVRYLTQLHDALAAELAESDLEEEAAIEFERVAELEWTPDEAHRASAYLRIKGAKKLDRPGLSVLRSVHALRERLAESADRPSFKVLGNHVLLAIADRKPRKARQLTVQTGLKPHQVQRHGSALLAAIEDGLDRVHELSDDLEARRKPRRAGPGPDQIIEDALRDWRKERVAETGLTPVAILPNHALLEIATRRPRRARQIAELPAMQTGRRQAMVPEILRVVQAAK